MPWTEVKKKEGHICNCNSPSRVFFWLLQPKSVELAKVEFETHNFNNKIAEMKPASELLKNDDPPESQNDLKIL